MNIYTVTIAVIFAVSIFYRIFVFCYNPSLWFDEAALAINITEKGYLQFFQRLDYAQASPPLFMCLIKLVVSIFGVHDYSFRIIPLLSSILSLFVFYQVLNVYLKSKISKIVALTLFGLNFMVIFLTKEFKPYTTDVLLALVSLLFYLKVDFLKLTEKKALLIGLAFAILPWFSFASIFTFFCFLTILFFNTFKSNLKKFIIFAFSQVLSVIANYFLILKPNYVNSIMNKIWEPFFTDNTASLSSFLGLIDRNLRFFFTQEIDMIFLCVLVLLGLVLVFKESKYKAVLLILPILFMTILHFFWVYPFYERLILFLCPVFIISAAKPIDLIDFNRHKVSSIMISAAFLIFFYNAGYFKTYFRDILLPKNYYLEETMPLMKIIQDNIKQGETIAVIHGSDVPFFYYNENYFHFSKDRYFVVSKEEDNPEKYTESLNNLKSGTYWILITHHPQKFVRYTSTKNWSTNNKYLIKEYSIYGNYLLKVKVN